MDFSINDDGSLSATFMNGGKFAYGKSVDFRSFYIELGNFLTDKGWDDKTWKEDPKFFSNVDSDAKMLKGELTDSKEIKRNKNMYEQKFIWIDKGDGAFDVEIIWEAKKKTMMFKEDAVVKFKLNLSNRNMKNIEILNGNNKKVLQDGGWEFRNEMEYKNVHFKKKFQKLKYICKAIPIFSEEYLREIMLKRWYTKDIDHDISMARRKMYDGINNIILKYFSH